MANNDWLNRSTKRFYTNVDLSDMQKVDAGISGYFSNAEWIYDPDMSAVTGQPNKYWIITGDVVTLMDQAARDVVDADEVETQRDNVVVQLDRQEDLLRAFASIMVDELNILRAKQKPVLPPRTLAQLKTAMRNKLGL